MKLEWSTARILRASRVIPAFGTVVVSVRREPPGVLISTLLIPEKLEHGPETQQHFWVKGDLAQAKIFLQEFVDGLEHAVHRSKPIKRSRVN